MTPTQPPRIEFLSATPSLARNLVRAGLTAKGRSGSEVTARTLLREGVRIDRDALVDYQRLCGFAVGDALPHTYPHVLGFPLQAELMVRQDFPLAMPGLVHVENEIEVLRPLTADDVLDIGVHAEGLAPHRKGRTVVLVTDVSVAGERVWSGRSTYLARCAGDAKAPAAPSPQMPAGPPAARWRLPESLGRRYAAVSGDINPIHLHALSARTMGFPRAIAHGMWTYARTVAALDGHGAAPGRSHVWFRKPVLLPSTVELRVARTSDGVVASLSNAGQPGNEHLVLTWE